MADIEINDVIPRNRYVSTGGEPSFEYNYPIFDADHLVVKETDPLDPNNPVTLVRGVDYAVTGVGVETGGTVVLDVGVYPTGAIDDNIYTIYRQLPYERLNDYQFSGDFESEDINTDLDSVVMMAQQLNRDLQSTIRLDETDELTSLPIEVETAANRAGRALTFAADGQSVGAGPSAQDIEDAGPNAALAVAAAAESEGYRDEALIYRNEAQAAAAGMKRKTPARAATTGALPTCTYANGTAGVGATLTATANGALAAQDGVTLIAGEALLVKNQVATLQNGIYVVTQVGTGGTPWILTRQTDSDTWSEIVAALVTVAEGSTLSDVDFLCTSNADGTMGTTAITWQQQNSVIANGAVSTAAKIANGIITYVKMVASEFATTAQIVAGTASKFMDAAGFAPLLYGAKIYHTATVSLVNNTWTTLTFDTVAWKDVAGWHNTGVNPERITVDFTGRVAIGAKFVVNTTTNGGFGLRICKNGTVIALTSVTGNSSNPANWSLGLYDEIDVVPTDYIYIQAIQVVGSTISDVAGLAGSSLSVRRIK